MEVIPGMDLMGGRCVCTMHQPFVEDIPADHGPAEIAAEWARQGATRLFIADLDGARMGSPQNLDQVKRIMEASRVPVDLGGGIRSLETAKRVLDMGVDRIVVGTTAALESDLAEEIFGYIGDRAILSVASLNGYVAVRDWQARTDERSEHFVKRMCEIGARRIAFTDVSRKGMRGGVNTLAIARIARTVNVPIIASGGVSSLDDIRELKQLESMSIEGVVVVTAVYSGAVSLAEAIQIASRGE
jgi:phosphoribosylformimino-5-aminoimidazole carboxamide ribotide isomerase